MEGIPVSIMRQLCVGRNALRQQNSDWLVLTMDGDQVMNKAAKLVDDKRPTIDLIEVERQEFFI